MCTLEPMPVALLVFATLSACGAPADDVGWAATEPATGRSTTTITPSTSNSTTVVNAPVLLLQLCDDVSLITTAVIGNDPMGNGFDPLFDGVLLISLTTHPAPDA